MNPDQRFYLDAMGIQLWERRDLPPPAVEEVVAEPVVAAEPQPKPKPKPKPQPVAAEPQPKVLDDGVPTWLDEAPSLDEPGFDLDEREIDESAFFNESAKPALPAVATLDWPALQQRVSECSACSELVDSRKQTVFGTGNPQADWLIIGEAPGEEEDNLGEPFVGPSGELLNAMLHALGLKRQKVYITNMIKCRTPDKRDPQPQEIAVCEEYLKRQIALVQPKLILVAGRIAAQNLLKVDTPISKLRGTVYQYEGAIPVVATYHPAYLLRSPLEKRKAWADLCLARKVIEAGG